MCELKEMLKRVKLNKLMSYLIYDTDTDPNIIKDSVRRVSESYEKIFSELERLFSEDKRENDVLFNTVMDFATVHDNIYFETGVLTGFQLYKEVDEGYKNCTNTEIHTNYKKCQKAKGMLRKKKRKCYWKSFLIPDWTLF